MAYCAGWVCRFSTSVRFSNNCRKFSRDYFGFGFSVFSFIHFLVEIVLQSELGVQLVCLLQIPAQLVP